MTLGPLEYAVLGFDGNRFNGEIARELQASIDDKSIRLIDAVFLSKDIDGAIAVVELDNRDDPRFGAFAGIVGDLMGIFTAEDMAALGEELPVNTSALAVLFEHRWAGRLKEAITNAGGFLLSRETVDPDAVSLINAELATA